MPIEFACEACAQLLRVPDDSGGQACQCPACQQVVRIPDPETLEQSPAERGPEKPSGKIKIACPKCRFELIGSRELIGTKGQCRNCQTIFTIATDGSWGSSAQSADSPGWVFNCPRCQQLFEGQPEMEGRKGKCHACGNVFAIEVKPLIAEKKKSASAAPIKRIPHAELSSAGVPAVGPSSASQASSRTIRFSCTQCQGMMEVPGTTAGRTTQCPYCQQLLPIPDRSEVDAASSPSSGKYFAPHVESQPRVFPDVPATNSRTSGAANPELEDASCDLASNPYAVPRLDPYAPVAGADPWRQPSGRKRIRGLTFGNVFELTFDSFFPYGFVAAALFTLVGVLAFTLVLAVVMLGGLAIQALQLDPKSATAMTLIYGSIGIVVMVVVFLVTAVYCATCNTALQAVRRREITSQILFGTGESYGGMLVVFFGWTGFNILRDQGIPWIVRELGAAGQADTAAIIGVIAVVVMAFLQIVFTMLLAFLPYALLDGQSLADSLATSSSIFLGNFLTVLAVTICGGMLYLLVSVLSCGLGLILFAGWMLYLYAAIYQLAEKS